MLSGLDIVCVAPSFWRSESPLNVHHVMGRLAGRNRILFVESPGLRAPGISARDWRKVSGRLGAAFRGLEEARDGLWLHSPLVLPFHGRAWVRRLNARLLRRGVRRAMARLGMRRPILWVFLPTGAGLAGGLDELLLVYHCVDEYAQNPGVDASAVTALEDRLLERCDLLFATSRVLHAEKRPRRGRSYYLPNVADAPRFEAGGPLPGDLQDLQRPLLGYVGNVAGYKMDLALLANAAASRPDWSFCLIGPRGAGDPGTRLEQLASLPNVHLLGPRSYQTLPAYVAAFDVCLIPFLISPSTRASFPLKFFEYMAAGKEIVATPLPALTDYQDRPELCRFAGDAAAFVRELEAALATPQTPALIEARQAEARRNSWDGRMEDISTAVEAALAGAGGGDRP